ncbi:MAG: sigma-54 dependent transcriptional regulator [bacterium]
METEESPRNLLVVDDEEHMRFFLKEALSRENCDVKTAASGVEALEMIRADNFDVVILDNRMPRVGGMDVLTEIKKLNPEIPVIMMTAYGSKQVAMEAIEKGAYDYFTKPFDINEMRVVVKRALEKQKLEEEIKSLRRQLGQKYDFEGIIGSSREMQEVFDLMTKVINNDVTVILYGESGTGKELIATLIHKKGPREGKNLVKINCAAIPETLLESELFGHEKGAFTGAASRKIGKFEVADGGTLFLDEVADMSLATQAKLLRVLEEREFERLGGTEVIKIDIRLITATNQDLLTLVNQKRFREDLYFRLNVVPIFIPPLRARRADIPLLIEHFLGETTEKFNKELKGFSRKALRLLIDYDWHGNVRELENVIQRAVVTAQSSIIDEEALPITVRKAQSQQETINYINEHFVQPLPQIVESIAENTERQLIIEALEKTNWSRKKTAELLKICRKSLHNKMKKYGIEEP